MRSRLCPMLTPMVVVLSVQAGSSALTNEQVQAAAANAVVVVKRLARDELRAELGVSHSRKLHSQGAFSTRN